MMHLQKIKGLILDMDGVLWRGSTPIGNLESIFTKIQNQGYKYVLATNNSTLSIEEYKKKLSLFKVLVSSDQVITSSLVTAHYLHTLFPAGGNVFIIGENGLQHALGERNFSHANKDVVAVVVGMDRQLSYEKLAQATLLIRDGAKFIATNSDRTFPTPQGFVPGAGALLSLLSTATDVQPEVIGKPAVAMYQYAMDRLQLDPSEILVVGDRLETDILGAQELEINTALVLSGVSKREEAEMWSPKINYIADDLEDLLQSINTR
jgi:4-nitrophenyl phosphatase